MKHNINVHNNKLESFLSESFSKIAVNVIFRKIIKNWVEILRSSKMMKFFIFCVAVNAYQNIEGCSTKTFKYEEYGYQNVEDLRRQFRCYGPREGVHGNIPSLTRLKWCRLFVNLVTKIISSCTQISISYSALPVTNNTIYDLYDLYNEIIENPDYDIYDANWTVSDTFGCACGIGACVDEEKTNITAPNGYIQCECAPGTKWNALGVRFRIYRYPIYIGI